MAADETEKRGIRTANKLKTDGRTKGQVRPFLAQTPNKSVYIAARLI